MSKFFNKNLSTIYVPLTGIIDKETYLKVLDLVISVKEYNKINKKIKDEKKQKIVVLIDSLTNDNNGDYSRAVFNLLSTVRDQLYTVITGAASKYTTLIFLLAKKNRRYILPCTRLSVSINTILILKNRWHDKEFENLPEEIIDISTLFDNEIAYAQKLFSIKFSNSLDELFK